MSEEFDDIFRRRMQEAESAVPSDLWDALSAQKFDEQFRQRLGSSTSSVAAGAWSGIRTLQFDQSISALVSHAQSPVNPKAWTRIERQLRKRDRTPVLIFLLLGLLLIGGAAVVVWNWQQFDIPEASSPESAVVDEKLQDEDPRGDNRLSLIPINSQSDAETSFEGEAKASLESASNIHGSSTQTAGPPHKNLSEVTSVIQPKNDTEVGPSLDQNERAPTTFLEDNTETASDLPSATSNTKGTIAKTSSAVTVGSAGMISTPSIVERREPIEAHVVPGITLKHLQFDRNPQINCPNLSVRRGSSLFLELRLTPGYPLRSLKDTSDNEESTPYIERRKNTEQPTSTFGIQALVGLEFDNLEVKTGVVLSQVHEVFDFIDQTSSRTIVDTIRDMSGNVVDISIVREYGTRLKRSNNRYTFIDIPIIVGYRFRPREDHSLWLRAGAFVNLAFLKRGNILSESEEVLDLKEVEIFETRAGLRGTVSIGYELDITDKNSIGLQMIYSHPFSSLTKDTYPIRQEYRRAQVGFSWKHKLW